MPNLTIPATGEALPSRQTFDRRAILIRAWELHNRHFAARPWLAVRFDRSYFAHCLAVAWQEAKDARLTATARRAASIKAEIDGLKFKSFQINTEPTRARLEAELRALAA